VQAHALVHFSEHAQNADKSTRCRAVADGSNGLRQHRIHIMQRFVVSLRHRTHHAAEMQRMKKTWISFQLLISVARMQFA
jgi:hypothetical protein